MNPEYKLYIYVVMFIVLCIGLGIQDCIKDGCKPQQTIIIKQDPPKRFGINFDVYPRFINK